MFISRPIRTVRERDAFSYGGGRNGPTECFYFFRSSDRIQKPASPLRAIENTANIVRRFGISLSQIWSAFRIDGSNTYITAACDTGVNSRLLIATRLVDRFQLALETFLDTDFTHRPTAAPFRNTALANRFLFPVFHTLLLDMRRIRLARCRYDSCAGHRRTVSHSYRSSFSINPSRRPRPCLTKRCVFKTRVDTIDRLAKKVTPRTKSHTTLFNYNIVKTISSLAYPRSRITMSDNYSRRLKRRWCRDLLNEQSNN